MIKKLNIEEFGEIMFEKLGISTSSSGKPTVNKKSPLPHGRVPTFPREQLEFKYYNYNMCLMKYLLHLLGNFTLVICCEWYLLNLYGGILSKKY